MASSFHSSRWLLFVLIELFVIFGVRSGLQAQGDFGGVRVVRPVVGAALVSEALGLSFAETVLNPGLRLSFGFATDEVLGPGGLGDSFTLTVQDEVGALTLVLVTVDAGGPVWAPPTPGTTPVDPASLAWSAVAYPSLTPVLAQQWAYELAVALPSSVTGRPLTLYFDLFNNQDGLGSQGWFGEVVLVPEPGVWALLGLGALLLGGRAGARRSSSSSSSELQIRSDGALEDWGGRRAPHHSTTPLLHHQSAAARTRTRTRMALLLLLGLLGPGQLQAQAQGEAEFTLNNVTVTLAEVTAEADVYFRSMRLNRALNVWNVEVTVSNKVGRVLAGPVVLLVDGFSGTTGAQQPDGTTTDGKSFFDLSGLAGDGALSPGEVTAPRTLTLGRSGTSSPTLATKLFAARPPVTAALGVTRSLDEAGRPLPGVALEIAGPVGTAQQTSDAPSGVASFGQGPGEHLLKFSTEGYLPVWRKQVLAAERTTVLPNPRLTQRSPQTFTVTPLGGTTVSNAPGTIAITFAAGVVSQSTTITLTPLTGQNLPAFLPAGWSPLNSFWLESSSPVTGTVNAALRPAGPITGNETAALVRWNETGRHWLVVQTLAGQGTNAVTALLPGPGAYALVVPDRAPLAPPAAQLGQALAGSSVGAIDPAGLSATGDVTPPASPASVIPEFVTGTANLVVTHAANNLPSGYLLRGEVTETYLLSDGSLRLTPQYEHFVVGYQRPGDADPRTLHAAFPMRPVLLFGSDQLEEATVRVDVLPEQPFDGQVLDEGGGQVGADGVRLLAGSGRLTGPSAIRLRRLDATVFTNLVSEGQAVVAAFDLTVDGSTLTGTLGAQLTGAPAGGLFVVARVLSETGFYGLQPVERLQSDANGNLQSLEPLTGERLPGLRGSGQFVLVQVGAAQGLISGVARNGEGAVQLNMPVRLTGLPWLTLTDAQGMFQLVAPVGEVEVGVTDPRTGDKGFVSVTIPDPQTPVDQDVGTAPAGPRVAKITPAHNAMRVPRVGSVVLRFNEAVNPATVLGAIQLLRPDDSIVTAALTLNLRNTIATLSPAVELDANTTYRVRLAGTIADPGGLPLEGQAEFSFTTVPLSTRVATAQLIIYEPGATNVPSAILDDIPAFEPGDDPFAIVVHGQPGVADPEVPVILVNESTGETQTVLSKVDGSFSSFISGTEEDFVSATFVNLNGTRVYVPVSRQEFDDGFVGLYPQGGILEAQSDGGPVRVLIEPGAVESKAVMTVQPLPLSKVTEFLGGVQPEGGGQVLGGVMVAIKDADQQLARAELRFPVDISSLNLDPGVRPEDVTWGLAIPHDFGDGTVFEIVESMEYVDGELVTAGIAPELIAQSSPAAALRLNHEGRVTLQDEQGIVTRQINPPFTIGMFFKALAKAQRQSGLKDRLKASNTILAFFGLPSLQDTYTHLFMLPVMMSQGTSVTIGGLVKSVKVLPGGEPDPADEGRRVAGAVVMLERPPLSNRPGGLRPGLMYTSSSEAGAYNFSVPITLDVNSFILTATHPRFPFQHATGGATIASLGARFNSGNSVGVPLRFGESDPSQLDLGDDVTKPLIRVAHEPSLPAPGVINDTDGAALVVQALDDRAVATVEVKIVNAIDLTTGAELILNDVVLAQLSETATGDSLSQRYQLQSPVRARVELAISAADTAGNLRQISYVVVFGGIPPVIEPENPNDAIGPRVVFSWPLAGAVGVPVGEPIVVRFSEPVHASMFEPANSGWAVFNDHQVIGIEPSADFREATIRYRGPASGSVVLTLNATLRDRNNQAFDQRPGEAGNQSHTLEFQLAAPLVGEFNPTPGFGGGVVFKGGYAFALDRLGPNNGEVVVFSLADPESPQKVGSISLPGYPSAIELLPEYSLRLGQGGNCVTGDFLAVAGGVSGFESPPKYLWIIDVTQPTSPTRLVSANITFSETARVHAMRWAPPLLGLLILEGDVTSVHLYNVPALVYGLKTPEAQARDFPADGVPGVDANEDGDFCDEGDEHPIPSNRANQVFGFELSFTTEDFRERIMDFDIDVDRGVFGVVYRRVSADAQPIGYRTLFYQGRILPPEEGHLVLAAGGFVKRLVFLPGTAVEEPGPGGPQLGFRNLAMVILSGEPGQMALLDLEDPRNPVLLQHITLPPGTGIPQNVIRRGDGLLVLATENRYLLMDPRQLLSADNAAGHPAFVGEIPGIGSNMLQFVADTSGVNLTSSGSRSRLVFTGPAFQVVTFESVIPPANQLLGLDETERRALLLTAREVPVLATDRLEFESSAAPDGPLLPKPVRPDTHQFVFVSLPGGAGPSVPLAVASLAADGRMIEPGRNSGMPSFLLNDTARQQLLHNLEVPPPTNSPAWATSLTARRMSDDARSPLYNTYLAGPLVITRRSLNEAQFTALDQQWERGLVRAGRYLWVGLAPGAADQAPFLDGFTSQVVGTQLQPGAARLYPVLFSENPVIVVPGVMGSHLELDADRVWVKVPWADTDKMDMNQDGMSIQANMVPSDALRNIPDIDQGAKVYQGLLHYLTNDLGYLEYQFRVGDSKDWHKNLALTEAGALPLPLPDPLPQLYVFPYDWRWDNGTSAVALKRYVDLVLEMHPESDQVDLLAHSMGGLVSRRLINDHPGAVSRLITIGTPWLGAPKALAAMKTGDFDEFKMNFLIGKEPLRRLGVFMPSLHQLLPAKGMFDLGIRPVFEAGWDANENGQPYEAYDYSTYTNVLERYLFKEEMAEYGGGLTNSPSARNHVNFHEAGGVPFGDWRNDASGVEYYHLVGVQSIPRTIGRIALSTWFTPVQPTNNDVVLDLPAVEYFESEQVRFEDRLIELAPGDYDFPDGPNQFKLQRNIEAWRVAGDGTVPLISAARGYGSTNSLNAPNAVVYPVASTRMIDNEHADHNGMLSNPVAHELLASLLEGDIPTPVTVTVTGPATATEGGSVGYSATAQSPGGLTGTPVFLWDFGDGVMKRGEGTNATHTFLDDGTYVVTCVAVYPDGTSGMGARQTVVANEPPVVTLVTAATTVPVGATRELIAEVLDPGRQDTHEYFWDLDGDGAFETEPAGFLRMISFPAAGAYLIGVRVVDNAGGEGTATITINASVGAPGPQVQLAGWKPRLQDEPPPATGNPHLYVRISGHKHGGLHGDGIRVTEGGFTAYLADLLNPVVGLGVAVKKAAAGVFADEGSEEDIFVNIWRRDENPQTSSIMKFTGVGIPVTVDAFYLEGGEPKKFVSWVSTSEEGDAFELTFDWVTKGMGLTQAGQMQVPLSVEEGPGARDRTGPAVAGVINGWSRETFLIGRDNVTPEAELTYYFALDSNADGRHDDEIFRPLTARRFHEAGLLTRGLVIVARDRVGNISAPLIFRPEYSEDFTYAYTPPPSQGGSPALNDEGAATYCDRLEAIRNTVRQVILQGVGLSAVRKFLIDETHVWFFEQGTGACLWKGTPVQSCGSCNGAYKPGVSDNDYEVFFPAFVARNYQMTDADREAWLAQDPHHPDTMTGDWYFRRPLMLNSLGELTTDLDAAVSFRYQLPGGFTIGGETAISVLRHPNYENLDLGFPQPLTPAELIALAITRSVEGSPEFRKNLPDTSFFPFRREHFMYGVMSLERPPPFGDDPIGDAGMGRQMLLLKWLYEGAYVTGLGSINSLAPTRDEVFANFRRKGIPRVEGFEWAVYHDWAATREGVPLHVARARAGSQPAAFDEIVDGFSARQKKSIKKAGKAAIRATLARMVVDTSFGARRRMTNTIPSQFAKKSFEHHILDVAKEFPELFVPYDSKVIKQFLDGKLADYNFIRSLDPAEGVAAYVNNVYGFMRNVVQAKTKDAYWEFLETIPDSSEYQVRMDNLVAVDAGLTLSDGRNLPGRTTMTGLNPDSTHEFPYEFIIKLAAQGPDDPEGVSIRMVPEGDNPPQLLDVPLSPASEVTLEGRIKTATPFYFRRDVKSPERIVGLMDLTSIDIEPERAKANNQYEFTHEVLGTDIQPVFSGLRPELVASLVKQSSDTWFLELNIHLRNQPVAGPSCAGCRFQFVNREGALIDLAGNQVFLEAVDFLMSGEADIVITARDPNGLETFNTVVIRPLTGLFRDGMREPSRGERELMNLMNRKLDGAGFVELMRTFLKPIWQEVVGWSSFALAEPHFPAMNVQFASSTDACREIGKALVLSDPRFPDYVNPGRQKHGEGRIFILDELEALARNGSTFDLPNGTVGAFNILKTELLHELNFRANYLTRRASPPIYNLSYPSSEGGSVSIFTSENKHIDRQLMLQTAFAPILETVSAYPEGSGDEPPCD